jgi:integrase
MVGIHPGCRWIVRVRGGLRGVDLAHESADATSCLSNEESVGSPEARLALTGRAAGHGTPTAQTRLGHSDPRLTLAIYAQATNEGDRQAAERLGDRFMTPPKQTESAPAPGAG